MLEREKRADILCTHSACRDGTKGRATEAEIRALSDNKNVHFMELDLASFTSIKAVRLGFF